MKIIFPFLLLMSLLPIGPANANAQNKKIVMIAGKPSHNSGEHEHNAGILLFMKCLANTPGITVEAHSGGWVTNESAFDGAAAVVIYSDGGGGHPALQENRIQKLNELRGKGAGFVFVHYAVEPTKEKGQAEFLNWIGGCFEVNWSVNPFWEADFTKLPDHSIANGVKPFKIEDEWYYHMRFTPDRRGVTPSLTGRPTAETLTRPDGPHSGNP
ncbi:MAG: ThuA domain-containing protein, partial [Akkermansiaceae bacterium]|nr:ThuA domain-containing protein [Verrucomicrobiales bacterium]